MDEYFSFLIYSSLRSSFLDFFASIFNVVFSFPIFFAFLLVFYVVGINKKRFVVLSFLLSSAVTFLIKLIVNRTRPYYGNLNVVNMSSSSFPSGHTSAIFAVAVILSHYYPKKKYIFYSLGFLIGFFRIYSGAHYLSDVIFGAFLGWVIGIFVLKHEDKVENLNKKIQEHIK